MKYRETKATGKREEESERGERRKKRKSDRWELKKKNFGLTFMLQ